MPLLGAGCRATGFFAAPFCAVARDDAVARGEDAVREDAAREDVVCEDVVREDVVREVAGRRAAPGFRTSLEAAACWGITRRSPVTGEPESIPFAAAIALGDAPYCLPIIASVSPLPTLCIRHEARRSGGTVSSDAFSEAAVPRGTFNWYPAGATFFKSAGFNSCNSDNGVSVKSATRAICVGEVMAATSYSRAGSGTMPSRSYALGFLAMMVIAGMIGT